MLRACHASILIVWLISIHPLHRYTNEISQLLNLILLVLQDLPIIDFSFNPLIVDEDLLRLRPDWDLGYC